jgi:hypothetical protein
MLGLLSLSLSLSLRLRQLRPSLRTLTEQTDSLQHASLSPRYVCCCAPLSLSLARAQHDRQHSQGSTAHTRALSPSPPPPSYLLLPESRSHLYPSANTKHKGSRQGQMCVCVFAIWPPSLALCPTACARAPLHSWPVRRTAARTDPRPFPSPSLSHTHAHTHSRLRLRQRGARGDCAEQGIPRPLSGLGRRFAEQCAEQVSDVLFGGGGGRAGGGSAPRGCKGGRGG